MSGSQLKEDIEGRERKRRMKQTTIKHIQHELCYSHVKKLVSIIKRSFLCCELHFLSDIIHLLSNMSVFVYYVCPERDEQIDAEKKETL